MENPAPDSTVSNTEPTYAFLKTDDRGWEDEETVVDDVVLLRFTELTGAKHNMYVTKDQAYRLAHCLVAHLWEPKTSVGAIEGDAVTGSV